MTDQIQRIKDLEEQLRLHKEVIELYDKARLLHNDAMAKQVAATGGLQKIVHYLVKTMKDHGYVWTDDVQNEFNAMSIDMITSITR